MARVFLSFLGTGDYTTCRYSLEGRISMNTPYIQEALTDLLSDEFSEGDRIVIFHTERAKEIHWQKLLQRFSERDGSLQLKGVTIPSGSSEEEIWDIFSIIYRNIQDEDTIYLDVTHGFRTLPMLAVVLLNYTRFLKNTVIRGIFYGAFEAAVKGEELIAPVFNLTGFDRLQQWSIGADHLVHYGNAGKIHEIIKEEKLRNKSVTTKLENTQGFLSDDLIHLDKRLNEFCMDISTVRGASIYEGSKADDIKRICVKLKKRNVYFQAMIPIVDSIAGILKPFTKRSMKNLFHAVNWCIHHNLVQQGITLLQEAVITAVMDDSGLDSGNIRWRSMVNDLLHAMANNIHQQYWKAHLLENLTELRSVMRFPNFGEIAKVYENLSKLRNDINHAGFSDGGPAEDFSRGLSDYYTSCQRLFMNGIK